MTPEQFAADINAAKSKIAKAMLREIPIKVGNEAIRFVHDNFRRSGFQDKSFKPWKPAKRIGRAKGAAGTHKTLLSGRNHLFNSTRKEIAPAQVTIINDCPYAAVHNDGLHAGRGAGFTMPKRQFIGDSPELGEKIEQIIDNEFFKILNK